MEFKDSRSVHTARCGEGDSPPRRGQGSSSRLPSPIPCSVHLLYLPVIVLSCSVVSNSLRPMTVARQAPLSMGILQPRILEWVAIFFSRIFPTQASNPGLPHCRQIPYHLSHQGSLFLSCTLSNKLVHVRVCMPSPSVVSALLRPYGL